MDPSSAHDHALQYSLGHESDKGRASRVGVEASSRAMVSVESSWLVPWRRDKSTSRPRGCRPRVRRPSRRSAGYLGGRGGTRTHYPRLRRPVLYPDELRAREARFIARAPRRRKPGLRLKPARQSPSARSIPLWRKLGMCPGLAVLDVLHATRGGDRPNQRSPAIAFER